MSNCTKPPAYLIASLFFSLSSIFIGGCSKEKRSERAAEKMKEFISGISSYAKGLDSDFIIIPQNGPELAFNYQDVNDGRDEAFLSTVDAFGIEELFYNGALSVDEERLAMLRELRSTEKILVADYLTDSNDIQDAIDRNLTEGFICFPRTATNYDYLQIPDSVINENATDITDISQAQNYLYLISTSAFLTKQAVLDSMAATNYDVVLVDLFFNDESFTADEIQSLKTKANGAQRMVIAYISIGSAENYRYYWQPDWNLHSPNWLKKPYDGYEDEIWVKFWKQEWQDIIYGNDDSYIKRIVNAGFDGAYLDNVEAYYFLYFD